MSLFHPPADLPVHLLPLWPWIWFQRLMLKLWVRETYGRGVLFRWRVNGYGEVYLVEVCDPRAHRTTPDWMKPAPRENRRIAAALDGRLFTPAYARDAQIGAHPGEGRGPEQHVLHCVALDPGLRRDEREWAHLPPPDT